MKYSVPSLFFVKRDKPCFKRVMKSLSSKEYPSEIVFAKSISSIITHILIDMEGASNKQESKKIATGYRLYDWLDIQKDILYGNKNVEDLIDIIQSMLEEKDV